MHGKTKKRGAAKLSEHFDKQFMPLENWNILQIEAFVLAHMTVQECEAAEMAHTRIQPTGVLLELRLTHGFCSAVLSVFFPASSPSAFPHTYPVFDMDVH